VIRGDIMIQKDYKLVRNDFKVINGKKELNKEVLLQTFNEFCKNNIVSDNEKAHFNKNALSTALCYAASGKHFIWNIRVYETLGLDQVKLTNQDDVEESYLDLYNDKLELYGLSLNERFTKSELKELEKDDPDYVRKSSYFNKER